MSLSFKFVPLTFLKDQDEIRRQIRNTVILSHFFERNDQTIPLGNLIEGTQYGYNASALQSGKNKFLRISDITDGKVDWETVPFCDCQDEDTYLLFKDDILIARTGGTTGKSFKIESAPEGAIYAGYLIRIRANQNSLPDFLEVFLNSYSYWSQIVSLNEGEFRPSVNANKLKDLLLPVCSPDEQSDIVQLSKGDKVYGYEELALRIDKAIKEYESSIELISLIESQKEVVSQLKQSILQEAIQGKLTEDWRDLRQAQQPPLEPASELLKRIQAEKARLIKEKKIKKEKPLPPITDSEKPFELPEGWEWCRLGEICSKTGSGSTPSGGKSIYQNEGIKFIRSQNVYDDGLRLEDVAFISEQIHQKMNGTIVRPEDLLLNITGGSIGRCCIVPKSFDEGNINQHVAIIRPFFEFIGYFIHKVICSPYFQKQIIKAQTGAGREGLPKNKMDNILIGLPEEEEQKAIVEKVDSLMKKCRALEEEISQSEQHAQMLMQAVLKEAFEG
ncbi:Type I restriction-modification system, specificity subunit S [Lunatimonas lonarensis]|uniref:Type I restriction-modification system, specificity subunit S n=1 Tax=Lunatimonas lonarensis TaxID=1232681 RepID=R7ZT86_9BACT|nr:restriction endonuclease subunit S [Lunatimonas lonarensis]EON77204.1 Type I restriction-modification system, specificity subunit S [Lunatimonas lonarensis]